jgi:hypothetical protein
LRRAFEEVEVGGAVRVIGARQDATVVVVGEARVQVLPGCVVVPAVEGGEVAVDVVAKIGGADELAGADAVGAFGPAVEDGLVLFEVTDVAVADFVEAVLRAVGGVEPQLLAAS